MTAGADITTDLEFSLWKGNSKIYGEYVTTSKTVTYEYTPTETDTYRINFRLRDYGYAGADQTFYIDNVLIRNTTLALIEENNYYPFGLKHQGYNEDNSSNRNAVATKFKYNGKELQDDLIGGNSLDLYDYGWRMYDAALGKWHSSDPLAENYLSWSPYNYVLGNPIRFIDPDGMKVTQTDSSYVITGDDVLGYLGYLQIIADGKGSIDNLYDALEDAAGSNDGEGGPFATTLSEVSVTTFKKGSKIPWMETAKGEIGVTEISGDKHNKKVMEYLHTTGKWWKTDETPWCSAFINWSMQQNNMPSTNSAQAISWLNYGNTVKKPAVGTIAVLSYGGGKGHVGFVVGKTSGGAIVILGGNQSNSVKYTAFKSGSISSYVYPTGYVVAPFQYNLPVMNKTESGSYSNTR